MFKLKSVLLVIVLVSILTAPSFAQQVKVYDNTANLSSNYYYPNQEEFGGCCYGEYIHLNSATTITGIDLGYYCPEGVYGSVGVTVNTSPTDTTYFNPIYFDLTPGNNGIAHLDLGNTCAGIVSQDFFLRFFISTNGVGLLTADSCGIGSAEDNPYLVSWGPPPAYCGTSQQTTLDGRNLALAVYTTQVPEPGTFAVLGSGLVGLLAFRRRRK